MEIEYQCTIDDMVAFNLYHFANSPSLRKQVLVNRLITSTLAVLIVVTGFYIAVGKFLPLPFIAPSLLIGIIIFFYYPSIQKKTFVRAVTKLLKEGKNKASLEKQKLTLSSDGVSERSALGETKVGWSSIEKVVQVKKHIFLYIGSVNAFVIPKRAFLSDESLQEFLDYVVSRCGRKAAIGELA